MTSIDQTIFDFSPAAGIAVALMVGFLVFAVALDLEWDQFRRVLRAPRAPGIGLAAQFLVLPGVAFVAGRFFVDTPSIALGLMLVACCPGGALSNYFTGMARGDVATSISMTATSTLLCAAVTPLSFAFWTSMNPATSTLLHDIQIDVRRLIMVLLVMVVIPVTTGMFIYARHPRLARRIQQPIRRLAILVFATVVLVVIGQNAKLLLEHASEALLPVLVTFTLAVSVGWSLAWLTRLASAERRAVSFEVGMQNVGLAIGTALAFFPSHGGVVITAALWGVVHIVGGFTLATTWARLSTGPRSIATLQGGTARLRTWRDERP